MITVYTQPNCDYCEKAKEWLADHNIPFRIKNIKEDKSALDFIREEGHKTVPQLYTRSVLLVEGGYNGLLSLDKLAIKKLRDTALRETASIT